jgi:predicted deacylase
VTFDQPIANFEAVSSLVAISGLNAGVTGAGNKITINYTADVCADFGIVVKKGFKNAADITQTDDWSFGGRTLCYTIRTFGHSRQGRAMNAFVFGSGSKTVLFTGAIHGNEQSARLLMNAWISELDTNARSIPAGTRIVVIPAVNPDGVAANSRYNTANVDLNRNYNTSDWQKDVQTVNGDPLPGGGGSAPGSEPETQALMAYTIELAPSLTMSYHSSASYAIGNTCGNSASLADTYSKMTGYRNMTGVSGAFSYQITGTYDDWICERLGRASVLIELATSTNAEFSRNKAALWVMAKS